MQTLPSYSQLIEDAIIKLLSLLNETEPQYVVESAIHQLRKKVFEIIQRTNPLLNVSSTATAVEASIQSSSSSYEQRIKLTRDILLIIYKLIERENEENVIICFKIIIDYHRYLKSLLLVNEVGIAKTKTKTKKG